MTGVPPQSEPTRTAVSQSPGTLRGYLEGAALKSGPSQLPFAISQQAAAATELPVSEPEQGRRNVVFVSFTFFTYSRDRSIVQEAQSNGLPT